MRAYDNQPSGTIDRARQLRRDSTDVEKRLLKALRQKLTDFKWRHQMPVGPYFADITCFSSRLVIECDGGQHAEVGEYDASRTRFLEAEGYRVLRFWNNEVNDNLGGVLEVIANVLSPSPSQPSAGALPLPKGEGTS